MKKVCVLFLLIQCIALQAEEIPETPETAIRIFIEAVRQNDIEKAFTACAIDEIAERYDFMRFCEAMLCFIPQTFDAPSDKKMYRDINRYKQMYTLSNQIKHFSYSLLIDEPMEYGAANRCSVPELESFMAQADPARLHALQIISIDLPMPDIMSSKRYLGNNRKWTECYGADDRTERVALLYFEKKFYRSGFTLLEYDGIWKIQNMCSPLAGDSMLGDIEEIDSEEYFSTFTR